MLRASGIFFIMLLAACAGDSIEKQGSIEAIHWFTPIDTSSIHGLPIGSKSYVSDGWHDSLVSFNSASMPSRSALLQWRSESGRYTELDITFSFDSLAQVRSSYDELKEHLISLYGDSRPTSGYSTWKAASSEGYLVEVELIDGSVLFQKPELIGRWKLISDRLYED